MNLLKCINKPSKENTTTINKAAHGMVIPCDTASVERNLECLTLSRLRFSILSKVGKYYSRSQNQNRLLP